MAPRKASIYSDICVEKSGTVAYPILLALLPGLISFSQGGSLHMKYINANEVLPDALVEELQKYVQAGYIYVPAKSEQHKAWGELSGYRKELRKRNQRIVAEYRRGVSLEELAESYCLSISAIRKIIYQK